MKTIRLKFTSLLFALLMGVSLMILPFFSVDCASNPVLTISKLQSGEVARIKKVVANVNASIADSDISITFLTWTKSIESKSKDIIYDLEVNASSYNELQQESKKTVMNIALNSIDNSDVSKINRSKIYNFICNNDKATSNLVRQLSNDVTADFASAYSSLKPFSGTLGWILGLFTLATFMLLGLTVAVDIAYIVVPIIQYGLSKDSDNSKPKFVSAEAWNAVKKAEEGSTFREPLGIYFKLKTKQFMAMGVCLLYLISGQIYTLIAWFMDMFSGVLPD